ncbi:hypothetical protein E0V16_25490 [Salmonella enterica subsp. enterica serovar Wangata]|nr:hypothetical protein [Salmonella enterica subsp. enterica serovar Wangata]
MNKVTDEYGNKDDIDWDEVKSGIKEYTGEYVKFTLSVGGEVKGEELQTLGKTLDDSIKTAMGIDKYLLTSSQYMIYSSGFVVKMALLYMNWLLHINHMMLIFF